MFENVYMLLLNWTSIQLFPFRMNGFFPNVILTLWYYEKNLKLLNENWISFLDFYSIDTVFIYIKMWRFMSDYLIPGAADQMSHCPHDSLTGWCLNCGVDFLTIICPDLFNDMCGVSHISWLYISFTINMPLF